MTDQWVPRLFAEASALLFFVDSSTKNTLKEAGELFHKYLQNVYKYCEDTVIYVLASKWDNHAITKEELKKVFMDLEIRPISVVDGSAKQVAHTILDKLVREKRRQVK